VPRPVAANTRRWWWGALLVGGVALGWGIFARNSVKSGSAVTSVGEDIPSEAEGNPPAVTAVPAEGEAPLCLRVKLFDVEVDEAGGVRGAWLATEQTASTMVQVGAVFGEGTLEKASLGTNDQPQAWMRMPAGLCRVAYAEGNALGRLLPRPEGSPNEPNEREIVGRVGRNMKLRSVMGLLRGRMGGMAQQDPAESPEPAVPTADASADASTPAVERPLDGVKVRQIGKLFKMRAPVADENTPE
jgi:hypothetical protein